MATLSLHSLFELRKGLLTGTVMLAVDATSLVQIVGKLVESNSINLLSQDVSMNDISDMFPCRLTFLRYNIPQLNKHCDSRD